MKIGRYIDRQIETEGKMTVFNTQSITTTVSDRTKQKNKTDNLF